MPNMKPVWSEAPLRARRISTMPQATAATSTTTDTQLRVTKPRSL